MPPRKKKKAQSQFPMIKKEIKDFMQDNTGNMSRKDVAKLGVSIAVFGMMLQPSEAQNCIGFRPSSGCSMGACHANHANHDNHSVGGWC